MTITCRVSQACLALAIMMAPRATEAQDSLRVVRFTPAGPTRRALRSVDGDTLGGDTTRERYVLPQPPVIAHETGVQVIPRRATTLLRIRHARTDTVVVVVARVARAAGDGEIETATWRSLAGDSIVLRYPTRNTTDLKSVLTVPMTDLPPGWREASPLLVRADGIARAYSVAESRGFDMRSTSEDVGRGFVMLRRSDIAMHALDTEGDVRVWVTSLADARPLAGATIRLMNQGRSILATAVTDHDGLARLRYAPDTDTSAQAGKLVLEARIGDDVNMMRFFGTGNYSRRPPADDDADVDAEGYGRVSEGPASLHGAAFSDRAVYRPGERVFLKVVVRGYSSASGYSTPRGDSARWVVRWVNEGGTSEDVWRRRTVLGELGSAVDTFTVPTTARLGRYTAVLSLVRGGRWRKVTSTDFTIAERRVPELAARATIDDRDPNVLGVDDPSIERSRPSTSALALRAGRPHYQAGERALIHMESGAAGPAWVVLSDHGILWERVVRLERGANDLIVPIPAHARPGVDLTVITSRTPSADTSRTYYATAVLPLEVAREADRLQVAIQPRRARVQPRDTVHLRVSVKDGAGAAVRSELAVWAVDQGIAPRTAIGSPDLRGSLLTPHPNLNWFSTSIWRVLPWNPPDHMWRTPPPVYRAARPATTASVTNPPVSGALPQPSGAVVTVQERSSATPLYLGAVLTDAAGNATVDFVVPDKLTSFRVFAVAIADGVRVGSASTAVVSGGKTR